MKLLISFLMIFQMICTNVEFYGKSYIVYDSLNQYVVEGRNIDYLQSVASISKIMTAIVVIENSRLDKKITVDETINKAYGSCVYIHIKDQITIHVKKLEDEVQFMIKDTGSEISKKILDHIFEEFVTDTNVSNDSQKGIGLGLAICKAIVQAHGGKIWAKNEKDGACFIFTIPSDKELNV